MRNNNEYLNSTEIARIIGVTRRTAVTWINEGRIKHYQVSSRTKRIDPIDLIIYLESMNGDNLMAMAKFKIDIYKFLYSKYGTKEYWKEWEKQEKLLNKYTKERERELVK